MSKDFWLYLQIRSKLTLYLGERIKVPDITNIENVWIAIMGNKTHLESKMYEILNGFKNTNNSALEKTWEKDFRERV